MEHYFNASSLSFYVLMENNSKIICSLLFSACTLHITWEFSTQIINQMAIKTAQNILINLKNVFLRETCSGLVNFHSTRQESSGFPSKSVQEIILKTLQDHWLFFFNYISNTHFLMAIFDHNLSCPIYCSSSLKYLSAECTLVCRNNWWKLAIIMFIHICWNWILSR